MSIEGQCHFFTIYFPGFVCFVLYLAKISGERLQDHWSSGLNLGGGGGVLRHSAVQTDFEFEISGPLVPSVYVKTVTLDKLQK